jgi:hypothetical protein
MPAQSPACLRRLLKQIMEGNCFITKRGAGKLAASIRDEGGVMVQGEASPSLKKTGRLIFF